MRSPAFLVAFFTIVAVSASRAVIVAGLDGTQNTSAPADDPGWANVGSSGVYLGDFNSGYWVITATHVGASSITFSTGTYTPVADSSVIVRNADSSATDLMLFRISSSPGLPSLNLSNTAPAIGAGVTTIGDGVNRGTAQLYWSVNTNGNSSGSSSGAAWTWTQLPDVTGADASGYAWGSGSAMRHGANQIDGLTTYDIGTGVTTAFAADFDAVSGESQGATGDSGGAVFYKNESMWELVGIMGAIGTFNNQPGSTAVFGNVTYYASIPAYHSFIVSAIPEPGDIAVWCSAIIGAIAVLYRQARRTQNV